MADKEQILIDVQFDTKMVDAAKTKLAASITAVNQLNAAQKALTKTIKDQGYATKEQAEELARINQQLDEEKRSIKSNTAIIQASTQARLSENASLDEQRQALAILQKAFAGLTKEEKDAMGGQEALEAAIKQVSDSLKEQEHAIGDDRRNVGNYTESIEKAFDNIGNAGQKLAPLVGSLKSMGGGAAKVGESLEQILQTTGLLVNAGKAMAAVAKAQTVATNAQTTAQYGLNAAMDANPIGAIIAALTALISLISMFCSSTKDAERAQEAFNDEQERYNRLLEQRKYETDYEIELMKLEGATAVDIAEKRKEAAWDEYNEAKKIRLQKEGELIKAREKGKKKLIEELEGEVAELQANEDEKLKLYKRSNDTIILEQLKAQKQAADESAKRDEKIAEERKKKREARQAEEREAAIQHMEDMRLLAEAEAATLMSQIQDMQDMSKQLLEGLDEEEEEEEVATPEEQAMKMWGLDQEGVEYFKSLLDEGVSFAEAKTKAISDQTARMAKSWATSFGNLGSAFTEMGNMLGEFSEESETAAKAQKAFTLTGILLNQASSIANGALAISEGVASAAGIPFPANITAIISIVAQIAAMMAGVGTSIVQAKNLFKSADAQKMEHGGIVEGTSYTGDKVPVLADSREMMLPMDAQKNLFDALSSNNDGTRTLGFDYELMAAANAALPAPVMDYTEFSQFKQNVSTYNEIASV